MSNGVSVVMVTRNRPALARQAVSSILACDHSDFEVVVVDQGDVPLELEGRPRVRLLRSGPGLCQGRNLGISKARFDRIGCTDDDCVVPRDWVGRVAQVLEGQRVGLAFGSVCAGQAKTGVIPAHLQTQARLVRTPWRRNRVEGMGACMALRRDTWSDIGGFDENLGALAVSHAGDETDFAIRALVAGWGVRTDPGFELVHLGERQDHELDDLISSYWRSTGAVFAKFLRLSPGPAVLSMADLALRWMRGGDSQVARTTGAGRWTRMETFLSGFRKGWNRPLHGSCFAAPIIGGK